MNERIVEICDQLPQNSLEAIFIIIEHEPYDDDMLLITAIIECKNRKIKEMTEKLSKAGMHVYKLLAKLYKNDKREYRKIKNLLFELRQIDIKIKRDN